MDCRKAFDFLGGQHEKISNQYDHDLERYACGHAVGVCAITWNGDVVTCAMDADGKTIYGNVNEQSISEIWKNRNDTLVKEHLNHNWDNLPEVCKNCIDWMIVGEQRFDENGKAVKRSYNADEFMQVTSS